MSFKIGVMIESFRLGVPDGLAAAARLGVQGVQLHATRGETHFSKLRGGALADFRRQVTGLGLEVAAVCGDFGGHGFQVVEENSQRIEDSKRVMDLAGELDCSVVTTHIGIVPHDAGHPRYAVLARACEELGRYAESAGAAFAIETGPEPAAVLRRFLDDIGLAGGLAVNFDPANLVMVCRENIPEAVRLLGPYIRHTPAKDGLNLKPVDADRLYGAFEDSHLETLQWADYFREVPLGKGGVNFPEYLAALRAADYSGYLTIEREVGNDPYRDIAQAVEFLKALNAQ